MTSFNPVAYLPNFGTVTQSPELELQNSIKQGNVASINELIGKGISVNTPLPNGELPLHFAVRKNQQEVVSILLKTGADPEIKDSQNLNAIDHAVLMKNEGMLASILGNKIGKDLQEVQEQIKCKGSASRVNQLRNRTQNLSTVDVKKLTLLNQAAYFGNLKQLQSNPNPAQLNEVDEQGLLPIHYAILNNQKEVVSYLLEEVVSYLLGLGTKVNLTSKEGDSLLHFAALSNSTDMVNFLIGLGADLNAVNSQGETPLHYAAIRENLSLVEMLVKAGSNPHLRNNHDMSPLALIGTSAFQRDPLALSKTQIILFTTVSLYWLSILASAGGWATSDQAQIATSFLVLGAVIGNNWAEFANLLQNLDKTWKKVIAWTCAFGLASIPPLNVGYRAWKTYHVARSAFAGLQACWKNAGYRNWAVARNVVVHSVNTSTSAWKLWAEVAMTYELFIYAPYLWRMAWAYKNDDQDAFFEAYAEFIKFAQERTGFDPHQPTVLENCASVTADQVKDMTTLDRVLFKDLDPKCPEHAALILSSSFDWARFKAEGSSYVGKVFRKTALEVHPDKLTSLSSTQEAFTRVGEAKEVLNAYAKRNHLG